VYLSDGIRPFVQEQAGPINGRIVGGGSIVHIVVVDPSRTILRAVSQILESDGHVVTPFIEGRAALDFVKSNLDVNVLITSAELSEMSGLRSCDLHHSDVVKFGAEAAFECG
jgi:PleD family two-component response regulator